MPPSSPLNFLPGSAGFMPLTLPGEKTCLQRMGIEEQSPDT